MADSTPIAVRMDQDDTLEEMLASHRSVGVKFWQKTWDEASLYQKFVGGEQWPDNDKAYIAKSPNRTARLTFDRISPILQTFSGRQIMQRFERAYIARHPDAARQAEIMTLVDRAMMDAADADQVESTVFKDGPGIQGIAAQRWELDTLNERGGGILLTDLPIWQCMADPEARSINLRDRAWHRFGKWVPQTEVRNRWPDKWQAIQSNAGGAAYVNTESTESSRIPWAGLSGNKPVEWYYPRAKSMWIEYEEWREKTTYWEVGVPVDETMSYAEAQQVALSPSDDANDPAGTGETGETGPPDDPFTTRTFTSLAELRAFKDAHQAAFNEEVPRDQIVTKDTIVYKYAYICGDTILETDEVPTGYWTIQFITGFRFPLANEVRWKSLVSRLIDPQKWINVMVSALIRNLQMSPKGLLFVEDGFFKNRNEALSSWASPGGVITVRRGGLTGGAIGYKWEQGGSSPYQGMVESLFSMYKELIPELAGFNPGALGQLGSDLRRISGEVVRQVQDSAMTSNAEPFDSLHLHRKEGGYIFLSFMRRFFEVEDIIRIVGEDVAYETVMEPATKPVLDPMTGQPPVDPATGQPQLDPATGQPPVEPVIDPATGIALMKPVIDPKTGQAQRRLVVPDKENWRPDWFKEIAVEDTVPTGDQLQALWKSLETSIQIMLQPQPDTGMPLFNSEDLAEIIPGIPAERREKMLQRIKAAALQRLMQPPPQQPPGSTDSQPDQSAQGDQNQSGPAVQ